MNTKLENRKVVEKLLGPSVEDLSLPPAVVHKISEGAVDEAWVRALAELEKRHKAVEMKKREQHAPLKAMEDLVPLLENLTNRVCVLTMSDSLRLTTSRLLSGYETTLLHRSRP
jgi:hypothetical protein